MFGCVNSASGVIIDVVLFCVGVGGYSFFFLFFDRGCGDFVTGVKVV